MRRRLPSALLLCVAAGCAAGPSYRRPNVDMPQDWRPAPPVADSLRQFYDSLRAHRDTLPLVPSSEAVASADGAAPDGAAPDGAAPGPPVLLSDTLANLSWFDLLVDPELRKLVETAIRQNRDVRVALAAIDEFRAQYGVARGDFFPQVTLNAQAGPTQTAFGSLGTFRFNEITGTANLQWELDVWGRIRRSTEAARSDLLSRQETQRAVVLTLVGDVATAYLQLRQLDLSLEIARRTLAANQETLRLARRRFDQGVISELDVRQFESAVASPAASVAQLEGQITQQENRLSVLVGRNPGSIRRGRPLPDVLGTLVIPAYLPSSLLDRRPDVRQAEAQLHAATARIGAAQGNLLPTFSVTGSYGTFSSNTSDLFRARSEIYQVFGGVSVPIFTGGKVGKQVDVARARVEQSRFTYERTVLTALQEVQDALAGVRASRNQAAAQQTQVDALRRALQLAERRYKAGVASYLDLLDAQRNLFTTELALAQIQGQEASAAVTLYKALGGGWTATAADSAAPRR